MEGEDYVCQFVISEPLRRPEPLSPVDARDIVITSARCCRYSAGTIVWIFEAFVIEHISTVVSILNSNYRNVQSQWSYSAAHVLRWTRNIDYRLLLYLYAASSRSIPVRHRRFVSLSFEVKFSRWYFCAARGLSVPQNRLFDYLRRSNVSSVVVENCLPFQSKPKTIDVDIGRVSFLFLERATPYHPTR